MRVLKCFMSNKIDILGQKKGDMQLQIPFIPYYI